MKRRTLSDVRKAWWASLTPEQRAEHVAKAAAGRAVSPYKPGLPFGSKTNNPYGRNGKPRGGVNAS